MCNESFCSKTLSVDLSEDCDKIIQECLEVIRFKRDYMSNFNEGELIECCCCSEEDIDNKYNFINICCDCRKKCCLKCFEEIQSNLR